jgi:hypothetical protein
MITSLGYHTFTIYRTLTVKEARALYQEFKTYRDLYPHRIFIIPPDDSNERLNESDNHWLRYNAPKFHNIRYRKPIGIEWVLKFDSRSPSRGVRGIHDEPRPCSIKATINPKILAGIRDYVTAADESYLDNVRENFDREVERISPLIGRFDRFLLNRVDYCVNFDLDELGIECSPDDMMKLMKRGYQPSNLEERVEYSVTSRRKLPGDNLYLENKSITVNCYGKHSELMDKFPNCPNIGDAKNVVRFEIQCEYPKVYAMSKKIKGSIRPDSIVQSMLSDHVAEDTIKKYFARVIGCGDYYPLTDAKLAVVRQDFQSKKTHRLIETLELVNRCRGISKAMDTLSGKELEDFKRSLRELESIQVNPVTLPREWGIKRIPNLMATYINFVGKQRQQERSQLREQLEQEELINEYLYDRKIKKRRK